MNLQGGGDKLDKQIEKQTFDSIFAKYWERLYSYVFKMTSDKEISRNIVQDVFVDLWEKRKKTQIVNIENYLFRAVKFQVFSYYRNKKMNKEVLQEKFEDFIEEYRDNTDFQLLNKLDNLLDKLPARRGKIVKMNKMHDMSIREIAEQLNISQQTVKNQLHR